MPRTHLRASLALALVLTACDGPACIDADLDGLGVGCAMGLDCDDTNAARGVDCDAVPPPDCAADPTETGCICLAGTATDCFPGENDRVGVGLCTAGRARCVAGHFGLCSGASAASGEICDGLDQDCDGRTDEGVLSPCGGCERGCRGGVWGGPASPFDASTAEPPGTLEVTAAGELTLRRTTEATGTVWVPNAADGTISRIDETSLTEVARYRSGGAEPSRVAVDAQGDAWIANRAFDDQSSVVEIAGDVSRCVDLDLDGSIRTSSGPSDVLPFGMDECVLRRIDVGARGEVARAMAIDGDLGLDGGSGGNVWVGLHEAQAVEVIDGATGVSIDRLTTPGFAPYGAAFDPWGVLWLVSRDGQLARIDPRERPWVAQVTEVPLPCWLLYSLAIDRDGRIGLTGFSCDRVTVHDPADGTWRSIPTAASPRGTIFGDVLWVAHTGGHASAIELDPLRVAHLYDLHGAHAPNETIGIGLGRYLWAIHREAGLGEPGLATALDPVTGDVVAEIEVGYAPHTQGDLTGIQRFVLAAEGALHHVFDGCAEGTGWVALHAAVDPGVRGVVRFGVRHAPDRASLAGPFTEVGVVDASTAGAGTAEVSYPLTLPMEGVVEVEVGMSVDGRNGGPRLSRLGLEWTCPGPD